MPSTNSLETTPTSFCKNDKKRLLPRVVLTLSLSWLLFSGNVNGQNPFIAPGFANDFTIDLVASGVPGLSTQMSIGPDGRLYVSSFNFDATSASRINSYAYNPHAATPAGVLTDFAEAISPFAANGSFPNGSLGLALLDQSAQGLGTVLYTSNAVPASMGDPNRVVDIRLQSIRRLNDLNGDGIFGDSNRGEFSQDIITGLRVNTLHQTNQLAIHGNSLYFGIGSRTCSGGDGGCDDTTSDFSPDFLNHSVGELPYTGAINYIPDVTQIADTTTPNVAGAGLTGPLTDLNSDSIADDLTPLLAPFADNGPGKFRVFSTGVRNPFGITADDTGNIFISTNQQQRPTPDDEIFRTQLFDDHGFDKAHGLLDNQLFTPSIPDFFPDRGNDPTPTLNNGDGSRRDDINITAADLLDATEVEGDFRTSPSTQAARDAGFFRNITDPIAFAGRKVAPTGLAAFSSQSADPERRDDLIVATRQPFAAPEILLVDQASGDVEPFILGLSGGMDVVADYGSGNFLVADTAGNIFIVRSLADQIIFDADTNQDGVVDILDYNEIASRIGGPAVTPGSLGDINLDGFVDLNDFNLWQTNRTDLAATVPEPRGLTALSLATLLLLAVRRRRRAQ